MSFDQERQKIYHAIAQSMLTDTQPVIDFQTHQTFSTNLFVAECTGLKYKNGHFSALPQHYGKKQKLWKLFWGKDENYFTSKTPLGR